MSAHPGEMSLLSTEKDQRHGRRIALRCPAQLFRQNGMILPITTENVSNCGFYCRVPERFIPGEEFECFIQLPSADAPASNVALVLACRCRVARVEALSGSSYGIGCHIEDYLILND
jgi:hypothetical protein